MNMEKQPSGEERDIIGVRVKQGRGHVSNKNSMYTCMKIAKNNFNKSDFLDDCVCFWRI